MATSSDLWNSRNPANFRRQSVFDTLSGNPIMFGGMGGGFSPGVLPETEAGWQRDSNTLDPMQYWIESGFNGPMVTKDDPGFQKWLVNKTLGGRTPEEFFKDNPDFRYDPASGMVDAYLDPKIEAENKKPIWAGDATKVAGIFGGLMTGANLLSGAGFNPFSGLGDFGTGGATGASGGGAAGAGDWWTELGLTPADVGMEAAPWTTNPGMADLTGGVLTDAGSAAGWTQELAKLAPDMATKAAEALKSGAPVSTLSKALGISEGALSMLGKVGAAGLQALSSSNQSNSLTDLANKYQEYGAPSRARYEASMTPGFDPMSIPGYSGAVDTASKGILARLSATGGNPWGNPGGLIDANKQIISGTAMPAINEYQRLNANTGFGSSMNAALGLQTGAIGADTGVLAGLASGLGSLTAPDNSLSALLKQLKDSGLSLGGGLSL